MVRWCSLYLQKNGKWEESIALSKQDKLYKDTIVTAAASASTEIAEDLLSYFVDIGNKECFAAMLYACFDLLSPDIVEELSWQHGLNDFYMPYRIQVQRTLTQKVRAFSVFLCDRSSSLLLGRLVGEAGEGAVDAGGTEGAAGG